MQVEMGKLYFYKLDQTAPQAPSLLQNILITSNRSSR